MCGIVGYVANNDGEFAIDLKKFMLFGMSLTTLRGSHGCGLFKSSGYRTTLTNSILSGADWARSISDAESRDLGGNKYVVGHCRAATMGEVNLENTHPFEIGDIVGVQNGTLATGYEEVIELLDGESYEVDSQYLYHSINEKGLEWTIANVVGSMSLVWTNTKDNTLNFFRNSQRPMEFAHTMKGNILFASDKDHLRAAAAGADLSIVQYSKTDVMKHYEVNLATGEVKVGKMLTGKTSYPYSTGNRNASNTGSVVTKIGNTRGSSVGSNHSENFQANARLSEMGSRKEVGDSCILIPREFKKFKSNSKAGILMCTHGYLNEDTPTTDVPFNLSVYQVEDSVGKAIIETGVALIGEIESVTRKGTVKIKKSALEFAAINNINLDKVWEKVNATKEAWRYFHNYSDSTVFEKKSVNEMTQFREEHICSSCSVDLEEGWETAGLFEGKPVEYIACNTKDDICRQDIEIFHGAPLEWEYFIDKNKAAAI